MGKTTKVQQQLQEIAMLGVYLKTAQTKIKNSN